MKCVWFLDMEAFVVRYYVSSTWHHYITQIIAFLRRKPKKLQ